MGIRCWWERNFLTYEAILAIVITIAFACWTELGGGASVVDPAIREGRDSLYPTLAQIMASLMGFTIAAEAIIIGYCSSDALKALRRSAKYNEIWVVYNQAIALLGLATVAPLASLLVDRGPSINRPLLYMGTLLTLLAVLRLGRCVWVLKGIVSIAAASSHRTAA